MQVGVGPQHREFRKEILQAMRVGVWAPTQKLSESQLTTMCKLAGPNIKKYFFFRNQYFLCMSLTHVILFLSTYYLWLMCKSHYIINH
ncbi:hypothetical protein QP71_13750 [Staphylococcus aureus]|nr:hypothetical protein QP71_13750 [Staphylococcus aureus]